MRELLGPLKGQVWFSKANQEYEVLRVYEGVVIVRGEGYIVSLPAIQFAKRFYRLTN